jgi:hypothetical protein
VADPTSAHRSRLQPIPLAPIGDQDRLSATLPVSLTNFVGRERKVAEVCALLRGGADALLSGPHGRERHAIMVSSIITNSAVTMMLTCGAWPYGPLSFQEPSACWSATK